MVGLRITGNKKRLETWLSSHLPVSMMEGSWMGYGWDTTVIRSKPAVPAVPYYNGSYTFAVYNPDNEESSSFLYLEGWCH
jgi:hypothetical protein